MSSALKIYTRKGDDGSTGLLFGGRVSKSSARIEANGAVDEAQACLGVVRAEAERGSELDSLLVAIESDLWVLMAEVATAEPNRKKLVAGKSLVTAAMVGQLEQWIDDLSDRFEMPKEFVIPGEGRIPALLDVARTVVRRAERLVAGAPPATDSLVGPYLNRLSDLLWTMARWQEADHLLARSVRGSQGVRRADPEPDHSNSGAFLQGEEEDA